MDLSTLSNLGTGAIALYLMWLMYKSAQDARQKNDERLDKRDDAMRTLESDIRNKFSIQLQENSNVLLQHSKIMEHVMEVLRNFKPKK